MYMYVEEGGRERKRGGGGGGEAESEGESALNTYFCLRLSTNLCH